MSPKPAPADRTDIERKVLEAAGRAQPKPFNASTLLTDAEGRWIMVTVECAPDGRWREVKRSDPTGLAWAEQQLADEVHAQGVARRNQA